MGYYFFQLIVDPTMGIEKSEFQSIDRKWANLKTTPLKNFSDVAVGSLHVAAGASVFGVLPLFLSQIFRLP